MEKKLEKFGWELIIAGIFFAIIGLILICFPETSLRFIETVVGILFIFIGITKISDYKKLSKKNILFNYDIYYGMIAVILGAIAILFENQLSQAFRTLIGIWIIYSGIIKLIFATTISTIDNNIGKSTLIFSIIIIICGIFVIAYDNSIMITLGIIIIIYSIMEIITGFIYLNNIKKIFNALKKTTFIIK